MMEGSDLSDNEDMMWLGVLTPEPMPMQHSSLCEHGCQ